MTDAMRDALEFGIWSVSGPTNDREIEAIEKQVEETWQEYQTTPQYARALAAHPRLFSGCLRDGVCRGVCRDTDCPNHDMVVAARVCVEPKQDGIVYPKEEK